MNLRSSTLQTYKTVGFGSGEVKLEQRDNGETVISNVTALGAYARRTSDPLLHWASQTPNRTFLARRDISGEWREISYELALRNVRHIAQGLLNRNLSDDRPVVILSENGLEHALLALACQYIGVPFAPISPAYSLLSQDYEKLNHVMELLTPGLVFVSSGLQFQKAINACVPESTEVVVVTDPLPGRGATLFADFMAVPVTSAIDAAREATGPDTIAKFLFTSGSTKLPKAVINTHRMLCANIQMQLQCWTFLEEEPPVLLDWLPWNHTFGGNQNFNLVLFFGGTMYIDDGKPTPALMNVTLANLREVAPTIYFNVPKGWDDLAEALEKDDVLRANYFSRLRLQFFAGAALAQPVWNKVNALAEKELGVRIAMSTGLGMTETAPAALLVTAEHAQAGQIGIPVSGLEAKLAPNGDKHEIRYRGSSVTPGYWRDPVQTREAFDAEGYFCSGDAVRWLDPDDPQQGFVFDGRVAEDFKLNTGTWVSVGPLRAKVLGLGAPYIQDAVITGHDLHEVGMLIIPNIQLCRGLADLPGSASPKEIISAQIVSDFFQVTLDKLFSSGTGSANRIVRATVLVESPSLDKGEITDKGSINQRAVLKYRAHIVESLYVSPAAPGVYLAKQER